MSNQAPETEEKANEGVAHKWVTRLLGIFGSIIPLLARVSGGPWSLIKAVPSAFFLGREIWAFVSEVKDHYERLQRLRELREAFEAGRRKDPTRLTDLFGGTHGSTPPAPVRPEPPR